MKKLIGIIFTVFMLFSFVGMAGAIFLYSGDRSL